MRDNFSISEAQTEGLELAVLRSALVLVGRP